MKPNLPKQKHGLYEGTFETPELNTGPDAAPLRQGQPTSGPRHKPVEYTDEDWDVEGGPGD